MAEELPADRQEEEGAQAGQPAVQEAHPVHRWLLGLAAAEADDVLVRADWPPARAHLLTRSHLTTAPPQ